MIFGQEARQGGRAERRAMIRIPLCPSAGSATCWRSAGLPPPGSGQRGRSPADGADRPPVSGVPLLWVAPHGGVADHPGLCRQPQAGQRLMRLMGLIYQRPNTSKAAPEHTKYPYLLGGLTIDRVNQVWCRDITYIPLARGFIYLVAIMDWHSRAVLAWRISNTLHADFCVEALEEALRRFGRPEIFNTDQGSQFTSTDFTGVLKASGSAWTAAAWTTSSSSGCGEV